MHAALAQVAATALAHRDRERLTPRLGSGRSAGISDGNRDGNDGSRQSPDAPVDSHLLSRM